MHKLLEYVCEELEELERKADKNGKLSMQEIQYMDTLAHAKKNLLTADAMMESEEGEEGYSNAGSYARGGRGRSRGRYSREGGRGGSYEGSYDGSYEGSYARGGQGGGNRGGSNAGGRGGSYERGYSREDAKEELAMNLKDLKMEAKDQETAQMISRWIKQLEQD